jgi:copper chaperone CopZ
VTEALYAVEGVSFAEVDLKNRTARVRGTFNEEGIKKAVEKAGFSITG